MGLQVLRLIFVEGLSLILGRAPRCGLPRWCGSRCRCPRCVGLNMDALDHIDEDEYAIAEAHAAGRPLVEHDTDECYRSTSSPCFVSHITDSYKTTIYLNNTRKLNSWLILSLLPQLRQGLEGFLEA